MLMIASVFIFDASGMKFRTNFFNMSSALHSLTEIFPSISVLSSWNRRSASPANGIAAISALKSCTPTASTLSLGKCKVPPSSIGTFIRPNVREAIRVFACMCTSIWFPCSCIRSRSRPNANVSAAILPAAKRLSTESPTLFLDVFFVARRPSKTALLSSMIVNTVSLLLVYTILEPSVRLIFPTLMPGILAWVESELSFASPASEPVLNIFQFAMPSA